MNKKTLSLILAAIILITSVLISGCGDKTPVGGESSVSDSSRADGPVPAAESGTSDTESLPEEPQPQEEAKYEFNPHVYVPMFLSDVPQDYWDSFFNLCDALRAGESTFTCSSEEAYKWAMSPVTLSSLFPPACMKVKDAGSDGTKPFENGVGRIYYQMPADEYVKRQAEFEELVADVLNTYLEPDDDDFEKCLKLYDYMESEYSYNYDFMEEMPDGANYYTMMTHKGQCIDLGGVYAYMLLQAGVQAVLVGGHAPDMDHGWTYAVVNGKGYHIDPTWALKSTVGADELQLQYFMMSADHRAEDGFDMDDLTSPLLPRYWFKFSNTELKADDDSLYFPYISEFISLDEENKIIRFEVFGDEQEFSYAG